MTYRVESSETFDTTPEAAYDTLVKAPLEVLFTQRSGPIPPVDRCDDQVGEWGSLGQSRRVVLKDGSSNLETLVGADRSALDYRYRLDDFKGPFKLLITHIEGQFTFVPEGDRTRVTWSWVLHPRNAVTGAVLPVIGRFWRPWARQMWPRYGALLPT